MASMAVTTGIFKPIFQTHFVVKSNVSYSFLLVNLTYCPIKQYTVRQKKCSYVLHIAMAGGGGDAQGEMP